MRSKAFNVRIYAYGRTYPFDGRTLPESFAMRRDLAFPSDVPSVKEGFVFFFNGKIRKPNESMFRCTFI